MARAGDERSLESTRPDDSAGLAARLAQARHLGAVDGNAPLWPPLVRRAPHRQRARSHRHRRGSLALLCDHGGAALRALRVQDGRAECGVQRSLGSDAARRRGLVPVSELWSAVEPKPITDDFLKLLNASFGRNWRDPRTWPWSRMLWAFGFPLVGATLTAAISLTFWTLVSTSHSSKPPAANVETSQRFRAFR